MADVVVRPYRPSDHGAGRKLWTELADQHRQLYEGSGSGRGDPADAFEEYLTRLDLSGVWVAEHPDDGVVGLVGLIMSGRAGRVEPVVVTRHRRGRGIGRTLLGRVAEEARRRGLARLTVTPESRNVGALRALHGAGYDVLSAVELTLDLRRRNGNWRTDTELHGLQFRS
ncbi:MAG TPA: GNAT family N-acetyltransferase [Micromonospora sp.]